MNDVVLHVLWAKLAETEPSSPWPQFVAAFTDGEVDAWPEAYRDRREEAQRWMASMVKVDYFFTTITTLARPDFEGIPEGATFPCAACEFDAACGSPRGSECHS